MTTLATVPELRESLELSGRDREEAQAVADGIQDAKAENTHRSYASAWQRFQAWAEAGGHPAFPTTPQAVALYLGHLAATGRSMASVEQTRAAVSHFHVAVGMQKVDNLARYPVEAEVVRGWRNRALAPRQAGASPSTHWCGSARSCAFPGAAAADGWNHRKPPISGPPWT